MLACLMRDFREVRESAQERDRAVRGKFVGCNIIFAQSYRSCRKYLAIVRLLSVNVV